MAKSSGFKDFVAWNFSFDTMDIAVAVIIAVINAVYVISGAFGFVEKVLMASGAGGWVAWSLTWGATTIPQILVAYIRKKWGVIFLTNILYRSLRWATGDPDGAILVMYGLSEAIVAGMWIASTDFKDNLKHYIMTVIIWANFPFAIMWFYYGVGTLGGFDIVIYVHIGGIVGAVLWNLIGKGLLESVKRSGVIRVVEAPKFNQRGLTILSIVLSVLVLAVSLWATIAFPLGALG